MGVIERSDIPPKASYRLWTRRSVAERVRLGRLAEAGRGVNNFDLLRLIGAFLVVFGHSFELLLHPDPLLGAIGVSWGEVGVLIFFSISGFLVARSWVGEPRLLPFAIKRGLRLLPGLIVVLLVSALVLGPLVSAEPLHAYLSDPATKGYVLNNATFQSDWNLPGVFAHNIYPQAVNGSLWTLPLELKMYVFVALAGLLGLLRGRRRWLLLPVVVYGALATIPHIAGRIPGGSHYTAALANIQMPSDVLALVPSGVFNGYTDCVVAFTIGTAMYAMRAHITLRWRYAAIAFLAFIAAMLVGGRAPAVTLSIVAPYIVLCVAYRTASLVRLPRRLGDLSYGMYLYAFPVQQTVSYLIAPRSGWVLFVLSLPVTAVLAAASWHLVERPALGLKRRLTDSRDSIPELAPVPGEVSITETPPVPVRSHL